ncbi:DUF2306 domain-containing protein [Bacillus suaedaesalsae]|uniref:DUF2306 domain-containing protein n=1 Tax=Bacillus suaedaesalsae TaxID=2810349 RepID=A0ABS2DCU5_9BACI|nr:DUF2306 domain-containing protein [Bacillus suaedaesalsae]
MAFKYIRAKHIQKHEQWMYRSYAVTFVAVTFRIWSALIGYSLDDFQIGYSAAVWVSLIGHSKKTSFYLRSKNTIKTRLNATSFYRVFRDYSILLLKNKFI